MRMHERLAVFERDVPGERYYFGFLIDHDLLVRPLHGIEPAEEPRVDRPDSSEMRQLDVVLLGKFGEPGGDLVALPHGDLKRPPGIRKRLRLHPRRQPARGDRRAPDVTVL